MSKSLCPDRGMLCQKIAAPFFLPAKTGQPPCSILSRQGNAKPENRGSFLYTCQYRRASMQHFVQTGERLCRKAAASFLIPAKTGQPACSMCKSLCPDRGTLRRKTAVPFFLPARQDSRMQHVQIALPRQGNATPENRGSFLFTCQDRTASMQHVHVAVTRPVNVVPEHGSSFLRSEMVKGHLCAPIFLLVSSKFVLCSLQFKGTVRQDLIGSKIVTLGTHL
jgi:hypothetical protein